MAAGASGQAQLQPPPADLDSAGSDAGTRPPTRTLRRALQVDREPAQPAQPPGGLQAELVLALPTARHVHCVAVSGVLVAAGGADGFAAVWELQQQPQPGLGRLPQQQAPQPQAASATGTPLSCAVVALPPAVYRGIPFTEICELAFVGGRGGGAGVAATAGVQAAGTEAAGRRGASPLGVSQSQRQVLLVGVSQQGLLAVWDVAARQLLSVLYPPAAQRPVSGLVPVELGCTAAACSPAASDQAAEALAGPQVPEVLLATVGSALAPLVLLGRSVHIGQPFGLPAGATACAAAGSVAVAASSSGAVAAWDVVAGGCRMSAQLGGGACLACLRVLVTPRHAALVGATTAGDLVLLPLALQ